MNPKEREQSISELVGAKIGETDAIARLIQEHHNPLDIAFGREMPTGEAVSIDSGLNRIKIGETLDRIVGREHPMDKIIREGKIESAR